MKYLLRLSIIKFIIKLLIITLYYWKIQIDVLLFYELANDFYLYFCFLSFLSYSKTLVKI